MSRHPSNGALMRATHHYYPDESRESLESKDNITLCRAETKIGFIEAYEQQSRQKCINFRSITDEWSEHFCDVVMDDEIGNVVLICRFPVDDDEFCASLLCHQWKARCGPYNQR